ncbi:hypothetical protein, partial [Methylobacterium sp. W2]|uniref:hypothetical protein n=1 Tax=Methylobacterium sp. W2 TaxID=2598107 RepID=UPI001D0CA886
LFIGGGQRGLRFGGRLLCLRDDDRMDDPADWLGDRLFLLSCVLVLVVWFCWTAGVDRVIWVA